MALLMHLPSAPQLSVVQGLVSLHLAESQLSPVALQMPEVHDIPLPQTVPSAAALFWHLPPTLQESVVQELASSQFADWHARETLLHVTVHVILILPPLFADDLFPSRTKRE